MLTLLLRLTFVLLAVLIGMSSGHFFYDRWFPGLPPWFGAAMGFALAVTMIAAEQAFGRRLARTLVAFLIALALGLALSSLMLTVVRQVLQNDQIFDNIDLPVALLTTYIVMITVLRNIDRWRVIVPFVEFRSERVQGGPVVVDASVLADARLLGLLRSGLLHERLIVHRRVLDLIEDEARSEDLAAQARARRALDGLVELRAVLGLRVEIDQSVLNAEGIDDLLISLSRLEGARLCSNDRPLLQRAQAEGLPLIDLASLSQVFSPVVRSGENISITIERSGEGKGQGVGFLADGSMVVVANGADRLGQQVQVTVLRTHPTANGRMVFAELLP